MQLKKNTTLTRKSQHLNVKTYLKKYFQSYLAWMYLQNTEFVETLTDEEITNFFLHSLSHPLWFSLYLEKEPFTLIMEATQYFHKFKENSSLMKYELPITMKKEIEGLKHMTAYEYAPANASEQFYTQQIAKRYHVDCPSIITQVDATLLKQLMVPVKNNQRKESNHAQENHQ